MLRIIVAAGMLAFGSACPRHPVEPPPPEPPQTTTPTTPEPSNIKDACENVWPGADRPSSEQTRKCARYWLQFAYGKHLDADALQLDPVPGIPARMKVTLAQLVAMKKHVQRVCGRVTADDDFGACDLEKTPFLARAEELFWRERQERLGTIDSFAMASIEPALDKVLAGELLTREDLYLAGDGKPECLWEWVTLRKLRNAAFARHGRPFASEDLQIFFYRQSDGRRAGLKPNATFNNDMLTATDRKNVAAIQKCESL